MDLPGINQVQVSSEIGLTFANVLKIRIVNCSIVISKLKNATCALIFLDILKTYLLL